MDSKTIGRQLEVIGFYDDQFSLFHGFTGPFKNGDFKSICIEFEKIRGFSLF